MGINEKKGPHSDNYKMVIVLPSALGGIKHKRSKELKSAESCWQVLDYGAQQHLSCGYFVGPAPFSFYSVWGAGKSFITSMCRSFEIFFFFWVTLEDGEFRWPSALVSTGVKGKTKKEKENTRSYKWKVK